MKASDLPRVLAFRFKTGCRQYPFASIGDFIAWSERKPYCGEHLTAMILADNGEEIFRFFGTAPTVRASCEMVRTTGGIS